MDDGRPAHRRHIALDVRFLSFSMRQNHLYLLIGALAVAVVVLGIYVMREESKPAGVEMRIDESGVRIEQN